MKKPPLQPEDVRPSGATLGLRSSAEGAETFQVPGATGEGYGSTGATHSGPMRTRPEAVGTINISLCPWTEPLDTRPEAGTASLRDSQQVGKETLPNVSSHSDI